MKTIHSLAAHCAAAITLTCSVASMHANAATQLYVANPFPNNATLQGQGKVTVFDSNASGPTAPLRTLTQPAGAQSLTLDSGSRLYSQYFLYDNPTNVYNPNASGTDAPIYIAYGGFNSDGTGIADATDVGVDSTGYMYKIAGANSGFGSYLEGYTPNATAPSVMIPLSNFENYLTVDGSDNVIVASVSKLLVYNTHLTNTTPIRTINSPYIGIYSKVAYSKVTGKIYVANGGAPGTARVAVFDGNASGNSTPIRIISGAATGLKSIVTGLDVNPETGEIYVLSSEASTPPGQQTPGVVLVYAQTANGNVAPVRSFTDTSSQFTSSSDIAFSPVTSSSFALNAGGAASGGFAADNSFTGGGTVSWTNAVNTSLLSGAVPPASVLQDDREGNFTYTLKGLTAYASYDVTLYFVENYFTAAHKRVFNVTINGAAALTNFDVFAQAGARYKAIQRTFPATANETGQIVLKFTASVDQAKVGAIKVDIWH